MHELSSPHPMVATHFDAALTHILTIERACIQLDRMRLEIPFYVHVRIDGEGVA
jgi:hypothetical protein